MQHAAILCECFHHDKTPRNSMNASLQCRTASRLDLATSSNLTKRPRMPASCAGGEIGGVTLRNEYGCVSCVPPVACCAGDVFGGCCRHLFSGFCKVSSRCCALRARAPCPPHCMAAHPARQALCSCHALGTPHRDAAPSAICQGAGERH